MSTLTLSGVLKRPVSGDVVPNARIIFDAIATGTVVLKGVSSSCKTATDGSYSVELEYGDYAIQVSWAGQTQQYGTVHIDDTTPIGTLNDLLLQSVVESELTPEIVLEFRQLQQEMQEDLAEMTDLNGDATDSASAAAASAAAAKVSETNSAASESAAHTSEINAESARDAAEGYAQEAKDASSKVTAPLTDQGLWAIQSGYPTKPTVASIWQVTDGGVDPVNSEIIWDPGDMLVYLATSDTWCRLLGQQTVAGEPVPLTFDADIILSVGAGLQIITTSTTTVDVARLDDDNVLVLGSEDIPGVRVPNDLDVDGDITAENIGSAAALTATMSTHDATSGRALKVGDFGFGLSKNSAVIDFDFNTYIFSVGEFLTIDMDSALNIPYFLTAQTGYISSFCSSTSASYACCIFSKAGGANIWLGSRGNDYLWSLYSILNVPCVALSTDGTAKISAPSDIITLTDSAGIRDSTVGRAFKVGDFNLGRTDLWSVGIDFNTYVFAIGEIIMFDGSQCSNIPTVLTDVGYPATGHFCAIAMAANNDDSYAAQEITLIVFRSGQTANSSPVCFISRDSTGNWIGQALFSDAFPPSSSVSALRKAADEAFLLQSAVAVGVATAEQENRLGLLQRYAVEWLNAAPNEQLPEFQRWVQTIEY